MVTETDRNKARSAVVSAYHALDCVTIPFSFLHAFADAAVDAVSTDAEPVAWRVQWREDGIEVTPLYAEPVKTAPAVAVKADLPERFEEWWAGRDSKGEKTLDYNQRKQLAWDAFYAAALSAQVQDVAGELSRINDMMDGGDDEGSPILPEFKDGWSVEAKVEACLHLLEKRRDVIEGFTAKENWRDDPAQDERWNAGLDFAMLQLCKVLKVDPQSINWDCATETLEGDAQSQIHKVLAAASPASKHGDAE